MRTYGVYGTGLCNVPGYLCSIASIQGKCKQNKGFRTAKAYANSNDANISSGREEKNEKASARTGRGILFIGVSRARATRTLIFLVYTRFIGNTVIRGETLLLLSFILR